MESIKAAYLEVVKIVQADKDILGFIQIFLLFIKKSIIRFFTAQNHFMMIGKISLNSAVKMTKSRVVVRPLVIIIFVNVRGW